jgi:hypothetical protein
MKSRKAQMEIMGLALIIVLLTLGILFVVQFMVPKGDQRSIAKSYTESQLAANMLNTILKSTAKDCNNQVLITLFQDCASGSSIVCNDGTSSCYYLNKTVEYILNETLVFWKKDFWFIASKTPIVFGTGCPGERESTQTPIQTDAGTMIIRLDICR